MRTALMPLLTFAVFGCRAESVRDSQLDRILGRNVPGLRITDRAERVKTLLARPTFEEYRGYSSPLCDSTSGFTSVLVKFDVKEVGVPDEQRISGVQFASSAASSETAAGEALRQVSGVLGQASGEGCAGRRVGVLSRVTFWRADEAGLVVLQIPVGGVSVGVPARATRLHVLRNAQDPSALFGPDYEATACDGA